MKHQIIFEFETESRSADPSFDDQLMVADMVEKAGEAYKPSGLRGRLYVTHNYQRPPKWQCWADPPLSRDQIQWRKDAGEGG